MSMRLAVAISVAFHLKPRVLPEVIGQLHLSATLHPTWFFNRRCSMETIYISGISLPVSRVGLGTWAIGGWMWGGTDTWEAVRTLQAAVDQGINLIDTAPVN